MTKAERHDYYTSYYEDCKRLGLCPHCKVEAAPGRVYCVGCNRKRMDWARANPRRQAEIRRRAMKKRYAKLRAAGKCVVCSGRKGTPRNGRVRCDVCRPPISSRKTRTRLEIAEARDAAERAARLVEYAERRIAW